MAFFELGKKLRQQFGLNPHFLGLSPPLPLALSPLQTGVPEPSCP